MPLIERFSLIEMCLLREVPLYSISGDYVLIDPIEEGDKVKGEIVTILYKDQIKYIKAEGLWSVFFFCVPRQKLLKELSF